MTIPFRIVCPGCGESDRSLTERSIRKQEYLQVTCESCRIEWALHPDDCPSCGRSHTLASIRKPIFQKARGEQQSIIGYRIAEECNDCSWTSEEE